MKRMFLVTCVIASVAGCSGTDGVNGIDGANGADGADGVNGADGADGVNGADGADGADGTSALVTVTPEAAGANCADGGSRIDAGTDANANGVLDADEIDSTQYVCNGADGTAGGGQLTAVTAEAAGTNCTAGGVRIDNGIDDNQNGTLDVAEIDTTLYVCDGESGVAGIDSLTATATEAAGANCSNGGVRIDVGPDTNDNGTLDAGEIADTSYVCNGDPSESNIAPVNAYDAGGINTTGTTVLTAQTAAITVPGSGSIVAIGSAEAFCYTASVPQCADGLASGYMTVSDSATAGSSTGSYSYFWLSGNTSNSVTRVAVFPVANAGTFTYYIRGSAGSDQLGFYRRQLTLSYIPH